ncbi:MAG: cell division protein FtsZ [Candidatus Taylorbacteria bacterium RIFCSPLOWO2_01_FULL_44_26]|uniref:Cell division protein FtsZ n=2 Tax=Candidatus Tayloriibacteriota TaxID=1817919 RepID=A0A1G2MJV5_9BACT|nr:MAG: cell division protein FtsZ [Candidatus Taylorbacteria bacterium RIFCSPHIGHO2_02_FULL_44_12]OHA30963.1 MAG: cell division protein FtsZ [Candidatus Taylorbacteria bacterium RIFCSPLOWO2_01_FULL_44_26]
MPQITPEIEAFARIKVLGVGGSGCNAINHMIASKVRGVDFIAINTDSQDLHRSLAKKRVHIGKNITRGLGTGMNSDLGRRAVEETHDEIQEAIKGADMVFVACGLGGGTGTGASPIVARTAKELGCLTVAVVTKPFFFEGRQRSRIADAGLEDLRKEVDAIIVVPNDRLLSAIDKATTVKNAFAMCDEILRHAVEGISDLITTSGIINIDFADIRTVMENAGSALMGIGSASGENRAIEAAKAAINSPLLDVSIAGAKGVLFSIAGGEDLTMFEIQDAARVITEFIDPEAKIIFGAVRDDKLKKNEVQITVIATGFPETALSATKPSPISVDQTIASLLKNADKNKIYNPAPDIKRDHKEELGKTDIKKDTPKPEHDEDDWGAIPAFLRRSRLK